MSSHHHQSVMLEESIKGLALQSDGTYIDATFGRGGHSQTILDQLGPDGRLIAFDQDPSAVAYAREHFSDPRLQVIHAPFVQMQSTIAEMGLLGKIDGILMDLGVSSPQLDNADRGFSFHQDGPLDMRMDSSSGITASAWLEQADAKEIADVLYRFGEEKKSRQIASAIKRFQQENQLETTLQLANIIAQVIKGHQKKHPATRSFQAIRIFINQELQQLSSTLEQSLSILATGGRLSIISFHSIEDRIVKQFIRQHSRIKPPPKGLPIMDSDMQDTVLKDLGKQFASKEEVEHNLRSRSAILRLAERTGEPLA